MRRCGAARALAPLACEALGLDWNGKWLGADRSDPYGAPPQSATSTTPLSVRSW